MRKKETRSIRVFREVPLGLDLERLPDGFVNVEDAARFLGVSDETIRRHIEEGRIKAVRQEGVHGRTGWRYIIPTSELNRLKRLAVQVTQTWLPR